MHDSTYQAKSDMSTDLVSDDAANFDNVTLYIVCQNFESLQRILVMLKNDMYEKTRYISLHKACMHQ